MLFYAHTPTQLSSYPGYCVSAILFYDYALTFWMEVERFWARGRPTVISSCFFLNRYLALLGHVPVMVEFYASHDQSVRSFFRASREAV